MQEQKGEERSVAQSKSTVMNLSSHVPTSSSSAKSLIASKSPGILSHLGGWIDTATGKPVATEEESGDVDLSESETGSQEDVTGKPNASKLKGQNGHTIYTCLQPQSTRRKQYSRSSG